MKKLISGLLVSLLPGIVAAQQPHPHRPSIDSVLRYLDPAPISSGLLVDKALPLARLEGQTGTAATDDTASYTTFVRTYELLRAAAISAAATLPNGDAGFRPAISAALADSALPLPLLALRMRYHQLKPTALDDGLLRYENEHLLDVPGRPASPYDERTLFVAAPGADHLPWARRHAGFVLRPAQFYTNTGALPQAVAVDLGDGTGWHPAAWNVPLVAAYATPGPKLVRVRATYPEGVVLTSRSRLTVDEAPPAHRWGTTATATVDITGASWPAYPSLTGTVTLEIGYRCDQVLRKPLIMVEDVDHAVFGSTDDSRYKDFYRKMPPPLREQLQDNGDYDLIFVNFHNGHDYIQRNAYALEAAISWINAHKVGVEPNVVLGVGMGGIVAKYALRHMEITNRAHNTDLYISFDAPHQGMYLPISVQRMTRHFQSIPQLSNSIAEVQQAYDELNSPAMRQLLVYHVYPVAVASGRPVGPNQDRVDLVNEMQAMGNDGYPANCRRVAISNGNDDTGTPGPANAQQLYIHGGTDIVFPGHTVAGNVIRSLATLFGNSVHIELELRGLPEVGPSQVGTTYFPYYCEFEWRFNYLIRGRISMDQLYLLCENEDVLPLPFDSSPGAVVPFDRLVSVAPGTPLGVTNVCTLPTVSALDIPHTQDLAFSTTTSDLIQDIGTNRATLFTPSTRFRTYTAPPYNPTSTGVYYERHTSFSEDPFATGNAVFGNGVFLTQQLVTVRYPGGQLAHNAQLTNQTFNFGRNSASQTATTTRLNSLTLNAGGELRINHLSALGLQPNANPTPDAAQFVVNVVPKACTQPAEVTVNAGGLIELGNAGTTTGRGKLVFEENSTLRLRDGATLRIYAGSELIIRSGAHLIIEGSPTIEFVDDASKLILQGEFAIASGATFQPTGNGYVLFDLPHWTSQGDKNLFVANDGSSRFILSGPDPSHKMAEFAEGSYLMPNYWGEFEFTIENGTVEMHKGAYIECANSRLKLSNAKFQGIGDATHPGYKTVLVANNGRETIQNCHFDGADTGLSAYLATTASVPTYSDLTFTNCDIGLNSYGAGLNLVNCTFDNTAPHTFSTSYGWKANAIWFSSRADGLVSKGCSGAGVYVGGGSSGNLLLHEPTIAENGTGVVFYGSGQLQLECGGIYRNATGVKATNGAIVNLTDDSGISIVNNGRMAPFGQGSAFLPQNMELTGAAGLQLENGHNDFSSSRPETAAISGTLALTTAPTGPLLATGNRWSYNGGSPTATNGSVQLSYAAPGVIASYQVVDAIPASSPYCGIAPCEVPLRPGIAIDCSGHRACSSCEPITTPYVTADSLHHAVLLALSYQHKYDSSSTDALALEMLKSILLHPLTDTTAAEARVLEDAYRAMQEIYAASLQSDPSAYAASQAAITTVIDQKLAVVVPDSGIVNPVFYLQMDKALTAYAANDLTNARRALIEAVARPIRLRKGYYDYWDCLLAAAQDQRDNALTNLEFFDAIQTCHQPQAAARGTQRQTAEEFIAEQTAKQAARQAAKQAKATALARVQLAPNPATGTVTLTLTGAPAGAVSLALRDLTGQTIRRWERTAGKGQSAAWPLDLAGVAPGVYVLSVGTATRVETRRLVVGAGR